MPRLNPYTDILLAFKIYKTNSLSRLFLVFARPNTQKAEKETLAMRTLLNPVPNSSRAENDNEKISRAEQLE